MTDFIQLPEVLKNLKPYLTLATQLDQRNEKNIAYYCRLYAVQAGMNINKTLPECKKFLFQLMDIIESVYVFKILIKYIF
jgi:vacuolar protein sorting-associated protein VTA1